MRKLILAVILMLLMSVPAVAEGPISINGLNLQGI